MLTQRERRLFDDLERQYYAADAPARPADAPAEPADAPAEAADAPDQPADAESSSKAWVLEVGMGICVAMVAICGLLGAPEGVVCFTGSMMILAFMHYHI